jgi:hypothetical protein
MHAFHNHVGRVLLFAAVFAALPLWTVYGQNTARKDGTAFIAQTTSSSPTSPAVATQGAPALGVWLPLLLTSPSATPAEFGTNVNNDGTLVNPGTTFSYGITELYHAATVRNGSDLPFRVEWTWPDGDLVNVEGNVPPTGRVITKIFFEPRAPLLRGTYQTRLFVNDQLIQQATATIQ